MLFGFIALKILDVIWLFIRMSVPNEGYLAFHSNERT